MIITIDGPAGTGKSSVAKKVAHALGFIYFDSGAMFRTLAWGTNKLHIDPSDEKALRALVESNPVSVVPADHSLSFYFQKEEVTNLIRTQEIGTLASKISTLGVVREYLKELQRSLARTGNVVFEGRDMGSVIFPHAEVKIFLTASPEVRAERRFLELQQKGKEVSFEAVLAEILERDARDKTRMLAPLRPADDAHIIDTSNKTLDEVVTAILEINQCIE